MALRHVLYMPEIRMNTELLTPLIERWYSETCTFHLSTSEMSINLEDHYRILRVLIHEYLVVYVREGDRDALQQVFAKRLHSEICTFHLSTCEMSVTLEDHYRILQVLIHEDIVIYAREGDKDTF